MEQNYKRKNYFIDKDFQLKFVRDFSMIIVVAILLSGALLYYFLRTSTTVSVENTQVSVQTTADFILPNLTVILLSVAFIASLVSLLVVIVLSHRLAGPMYRLKLEMDFVKEGDLSRQVRVRTTDQFQAVAKTMSEMVNSLKDHQNQTKTQANALKAYLESKNYVLNADDKNKVESMVRELNKSLDHFKT